MTDPRWNQQHQQPYPPQQDRTMRRVIIAAILTAVVGVAAVVIVALSLDGSDEPQAVPQTPVTTTTTTTVYAPPPEPVDTGPDFQLAKDECAPKSNFITILDGGEAMSIETVTGPDGSGGAPPKAVGCVLGYLGATETFITQLSNTRGIDGTREDTFGDVDATWTYFEGEQMSIVLERAGG